MTEKIGKPAFTDHFFLHFGFFLGLNISLNPLLDQLSFSSFFSFLSHILHPEFFELLKLNLFGMQRSLKSFLSSFFFFLVTNSNSLIQFSSSSFAKHNPRNTNLHYPFVPQALFIEFSFLDLVTNLLLHFPFFQDVADI
mmetsp:Transcript_59147/g.157113  ORF Transcript_59147/g.157113 Transcript_59147/m.157113 type:complete len:139 (+) Transcript_59147:1533-1949(+)